MATNDIRGIPKIPKHEILIYVSRNGSVLIASLFITTYAISAIHHESVSGLW